MKKTGIVIVILLMGILNQQCLKTVDYEKQEEESIQNFLSSNNITVKPTASGLYYVEEKAGTGLQPVKGDTVSINYITYNLNGLILDTNIDSIARKYPNLWNPQYNYVPFTFVLGSSQAIAGVDEGVSYMKEGGTATLVIPSKLAYHDYVPLAIYVDLLQVKHDTTTVK